MADRPLIGAHASVAGGIHQALRYAADVGAEVIQIFTSSSRQWRLPEPDPDHDARLRAGCAEAGIPIFIHAPYLINLGSADPEIRDRSARSLLWTVRRGAALGAAGVVVHAGSAVGSPRTGAGGCRAEGAIATRLRELLLPVLDAAAEGGVRLLVEPTAGGGTALAARMEQLEPYARALEHHPAFGVCLDTCHLWAAGHDIAADGGVAEVLAALTAAVGDGRLGLIHANGSRDGLGSGRDRHQRLETGQFGIEPFRQLVSDGALADIPLVVETGPEDHRADIALLKELRASRGR